MSGGYEDSNFDIDIVVMTTQLKVHLCKKKKRMIPIHAFALEKYVLHHLK